MATFKYTRGLSGAADEELRKTEQALMDYIAAEERRAALYDGQRRATTAELTAKYPALGGRAATA